MTNPVSFEVAYVKGLSVVTSYMYVLETNRHFQRHVSRISKLMKLMPLTLTDSEVQEGV